MLQMRGAAGAERDDVFAVARECRDVLTGHLLRRRRLAQHRERKTAAGLRHREHDLYARRREHLHRRLEMLRIGEVLRAAGEKRDLHLRLRRTAFQRRPLFAERFRRKRRQRLEAMLAEERHRQVAHKPLLTRDRALREAHELQQRMEDGPVLHRDGREPRGKRRAILARETRADLPDERGQVDAAGADGFARTAADAVLAERLGDLPVVEQIGQHEADGPHVDMPHPMATDHPEHGTDVGAGPAAHATEHLREQRIGGEFRPPVVEQHDMEDLAPRRAFRAGPRPADERGVRREPLGRGVARQHLQRRQGVIDRGHQLVEPRERHMDTRQRVDETPVALVRDDGDRARLRDAEVRTGEAHVGFMELRLQLPPRDLHEPLHVLMILLLARHLLELVCHLVARKVDGRQHHVRGAFAAQLHDPFAKIRLADVNAVLLEMRVQPDLFRRHGLGLHHALHAVLRRDLRDDRAGLGGIGGAVDDGTAPFRLLLEPCVKLFNMLRGGILHLGDPSNQLAFRDLGKDLVAAGAIFHGELVERPAEKRIREGVGDLPVVFAV